MNDEVTQGNEVAPSAEVRVIGILSSATGGPVVAVSPDGTTRELETGDLILEGEILQVAEGAEAVVAFADGSIRQLSASDNAPLTEANLEQFAELDVEVDPATAQFAQLLAALQRGEDITEQLEATAAGAGDAGGAGDSNAGGYVFSRSTTEVNPDSGFETNLELTGLPDADQEPAALLEEGEALPEEPSTEEPPIEEPPAEEPPVEEPPVEEPPTEEPPVEEPPQEEPGDDDDDDDGSDGSDGNDGNDNDDPVDPPQEPGVIAKATAHTVGTSNLEGTLGTSGTLKNTSHKSAAVHETPDGYFAVDHQGNADQADKIEAGEALLFELSESTQSFTFVIEGTTQGATYYLYNADGEFLHSGSLEDYAGKGTITHEDWFNYVAFVGGSTGPGQSGDESAFSVKPVSLESVSEEVDGDDTPSETGAEIDDNEGEIEGGSGEDIEDDTGDDTGDTSGSDEGNGNSQGNGIGQATNSSAEEGSEDDAVLLAGSGDLLALSDMIGQEESLNDDWLPGDSGESDNAAPADQGNNTSEADPSGGYSSSSNEGLADIQPTPPEHSQVM